MYAVTSRCRRTGEDGVEADGRLVSVDGDAELVVFHREAGFRDELQGQLDMRLQDTHAA